MSENTSEKAPINVEKQLVKEVSAQDKMDEITNDSEDEIKNISEKTVERVVAKVIQSEFSGPIPPPNIIKGYEDILPGAAERIISMAERQSAHRQEMERVMVNAEARDSLLGVCFFIGDWLFDSISYYCNLCT